MGRDDSDCLLLVFILVVIVAVICFSFGLESGIKRTQDQAIQAKAGHWNVDPTTGKTEFVFIPVPIAQ